MSRNDNAMEPPPPVKRLRRSSERLSSRTNTSSSRTPATSCSPTPITRQPTRLERFLTWCQSEGIHIEPSLDLRYLSDDLSWSISVHALTAISNDTVVATIPKTAVLSRKTSALSPVLKGRYLSESHETVGLELALCLLYERLLGDQSRFEPFISILPQLPVPLPFLHSLETDTDSAWGWLTGTETSRIDHRASLSYHLSTTTSWAYEHDFGMCKQKALDYFYEIGIPVLRRSKLFDKTQRDHLDGLEAAFLTAYSHVSSRDFIVDAWHGVGLVPVADLWNHAEAHTVQFESDQDVCEVCGVDLLTGHEEEECRFTGSASDEEGGAEEIGTDEEIEGEDDAAKEVKGIKYGHALDSLNPAPDSDTPTPDEDDEDIDHQDTLDMRTLTSIAPGEEMYNTYGALTNALMLTRYGFCLDTETDMERFTLDIRFSSERDAFFQAFIVSPSRFERVCEVASAMGRVLTLIAANYPETDQGEEGEQVDAELHRQTVAIDALYHLDEPLAFSDWMTTAFTPLFRPNPSLNEELDQDLVDRDHVHPLFASSTGRISIPLFRLTLLVHLASLPKQKLSLDAMSELKLDSKPVQQTMRTLHTFWTARLAQLRITGVLEDALQRLSDQGVQYIERACIQHAYQEYAAVKGAISFLEDLIS